MKPVLSSLKNPLYLNSLYIMISNFSSTAFGFLFWYLAARSYSIGDVGIATVLFSLLGMIATFSRLGFDQCIIRFMPIRDGRKVYSTVFWVSALLTLAIAILYLIFADFLTPDLSAIKDYAIIFILFTIGYSITITTGNVFLSLRKGVYYFLQNMLLIIKIPLIFLFSLLGGIGLFMAIGISYFLSSAVGMYLIRRDVPLDFRISYDFLKETGAFSIANYLVNVLSTLSGFVVPLIVLNLLGPDEAARYFIAFSISNFLLIIPGSVAMSFYVEGSNGAEIKSSMVRSLLSTFALLSPLLMLFYFKSDSLLSLFGASYTSAADLLRLFAISIPFVVVFKMLIPLQNIKYRLKEMLGLNLAMFLLIIGLSYVLTSYYGLIGIGYAWLATYAFGAACALISLQRSGIILTRSAGSKT